MKKYLGHVVVDALNPYFRVLQTVIKGVEVFDCNTSFGSVRQHYIHMEESHESFFPNRFEAKPIKEEDISFDVQKHDTLHVIRAVDGSLYTGRMPDACAVHHHVFPLFTGNPRIEIDRQTSLG